MLLEGKVGIITGSASGQGAAAMELFTKEGAICVGLDIVNGLDASNYQHFLDGIGECMDNYGRWDFLYNNAGYGWSPAPLRDTTPEMFDQHINANLRTTFNGLKLASKFMEEGGAVVNTSSTAALLGFPDMGIYSAAKAGVLALTRVAAVELAPRRIRVNAVLPGVIATPMALNNPLYPPVTLGEAKELFAGFQPLPKAGEAIDVAQLACWLLSDRAAFVTGASYVVDGGYSIDTRRPQ